MGNQSKRLCFINRPTRDAASKEFTTHSVSKVKNLKRKKAQNSRANALKLGALITGIGNRKEQIIGTRDKPQRLVVQRLLSRLQYPVCTKSSTKDLSPRMVNLGVVDRSRVLSTMNQLMKSGEPISSHVTF